MFEIGDPKINTKHEAYYNGEKSDGAFDWSFSYTLQFLFPKNFEVNCSRITKGV